MASPATAPIQTEVARPLYGNTSRRSFLGFFVIGILISTPATALLVWDYHFQPPYLSIGFHFLSYAVGVLCALRLGNFWLAILGAHRVLAAALLIASVGMALLEYASPPASSALRHTSFALLGLALGGIIASTFQLMQRLYERDPAATVNVAGGLIGTGALVPALMSALAYSWTAFQGFFGFLALAPAAAAAFLLSQKSTAEPSRLDLGFVAALRELRSPVHILFAALLFFETAAELSVAQWAALHLVLHAGMSPSTALYFLSFYFLSLLGGRFAAQAMLQRFPHRRLLLASAAMSWLGILILGSASNFLGAGLGLALSACGFSFVYPLLVERIGSRFREYHSSMFHGIFGLGMIGGFLAPTVIAFWASLSGETSAMTVPLWCSLLVFLLLVLLWIESKISASRFRQG
ncbi:MFS transporter [Bryobacter aggregatus]|uniref:MFS transporter n=1 Tax=Bryobacter aggregatus TaxID=360054 RepID=UPI000AE3AF4D|nr:MFS transporter [Bryobacter aggregatus]